MPARKKSNDESEPLSFEEALASVQEIIETMESDQLPLEDLVSQYEKGSALLKHCESVLTSARKKIELITLANREESGHEAKQSSTSPTQNALSENDGAADEPNDIRLF